MTTDSDALKELSSVSNVNKVHVIRNYIYIPSESAGRDVAYRLREAGFEVEDRLGADGINWLVLAKQRMIPTEESIAEMRRYFESVIDEYDGEYDGWEAEVVSDDS